MSKLSVGYKEKEKKVLAEIVQQIANKGANNNVAVVSYGGKAEV